MFNDAKYRQQWYLVGETSCAAVLLLTWMWYYRSQIMTSSWLISSSHDYCFSSTLFRFYWYVGFHFRIVWYSNWGALLIKEITLYHHECLGIIIYKLRNVLSLGVWWNSSIRLVAALKQFYVSHWTAAHIPRLGTDGQVQAALLKPQLLTLSPGENRPPRSGIMFNQNDFFQFLYSTATERKAVLVWTFLARGRKVSQERE